MKTPRNLPIYIVGLALLWPVATFGAFDAADVRVQEITMTQLLEALSPDNAVVLTSMEEFRELMRATVDKVSSP